MVTLVVSVAAQVRAAAEVVVVLLLLLLPLA